MHTKNTIPIKDGDTLYMLSYRPENECQFIPLTVYHDGVALSGFNEKANIRIPLTSNTKPHLLDTVGLFFVTEDEANAYARHTRR